MGIAIALVTGLCLIGLAARPALFERVLGDTLRVQLSLNQRVPWIRKSTFEKLARRARVVILAFGMVSVAGALPGLLQRVF